MRNVNEPVDAITSFGKPLVSQSPFKRNMEVAVSSEISRGGITGRSGAIVPPQQASTKARSKPPKIMNLNIEVEEAEPDIEETLEF